ncbi:MAG: flavodoxin [Planctomycetia bacterium]|nr:flavodoxin [Planctomycetia bacterium]
MADIKVIYGSTTGATQAAAEMIANHLGALIQDVSEAQPADFLVDDLLILGTSTWGMGDLQDDWENKISLLQQVDLSGRLVALFGMGDQFGFSDTYVDGMGALCDKVTEQGAVIIGKTSPAGYSFSASTAMKDGELCGLALDDTNESDLTAQRIEAWVQQLEKELAQKKA